MQSFYEKASLWGEIMAKKKTESNYKPIRLKELEEPGKDLIRWYADEKTGAIASFFDEPGNATMRICTQHECEEVGFPFSSLKGQKEEWFKNTASKWWKKLEK